MKRVAKMDGSDVIVAGVLKTLSGKALAVSIVGGALSLNVWFLSRLVATQDQIQASVQKQEINQAVMISRMDQNDARLDRMSKYISGLAMKKN